mgnify:CR=1 FL=1
MVVSDSEHSLVVETEVGRKAVDAFHDLLDHLVVSPAISRLLDVVLCKP